MSLPNITIENRVERSYHDRDKSTFDIAKEEIDDIIAKLDGKFEVKQATIDGDYYEIKLEGESDR